ncbi:MAG: signal peptide peptidase SppA [Candidatus Krumholzibacteria bacterium]|nr:signal peptide peptidase SppA [Candidatus Krumholzibacteria bacterium]
MAKKKNIAFLLFFGAALVITVSFVVLYIGLFYMGERDLALGDAVAVVDIRGVIHYSRAKIHEIESYRDNENVKAVLVFINSPGGGVSASQAIHEALLRVKEHKPVVAFMGPIAASGGYYVACAADSILAHEGTLTGSIGVIASFLHTRDLYQKIGLEVTVIKTGKYKDVGSPHRPMTEEEREYMGALLESVYQQFLRAVSAGRGIPVDDVARLAEGRLYSGEEALRVGLVDRLGTYEDALQVAADLGGLEGKPRVMRRARRRSLVERIVGKNVSGLPLGDDDRIRLQYIIP